MTRGADEIYHLECPSGLAGDMFLGACLDLGMPLAALEDAVAALGLEGVSVESRRAQRGGVGGTRFRVLLEGRALEGPDPEESRVGGAGHHGVEHAHEHHHDRFGGDGHGREHAEIQSLLARSALAPAVRERASALFARLAEVEGAIHGVPPDRVHFHEVGAIDSIVDITGAAVAVETLGISRLTCGRVAVGSGTVKTAHGLMPVPSPATAALIVGVPVVGEGEGELLTPTGALLLAEMVDEFVPLPAMEPLAHGYGLGRRDVPGRSNAARLTRGRRLAAARPSTAAGDEPRVAVIECQIDDASGEGAGYLLERLLSAGALDAFLTPIQMKKSRPGVLVTALCRPQLRDDLRRLMLLESGSLGCRSYEAARLEAERRLEQVATPYGPVRIKVGLLEGVVFGAAPEFEDCRQAAQRHGVPWREVHRAATVAADRLVRPAVPAEGDVPR